MLRVTLFTKDMKDKYDALRDQYIQESGTKWFKTFYDNTLVLLDGDGNLVSAVSFSYSMRHRRFTEMHTMTAPEFRRMGYQKLLLNAFARTVSAIPEFKGATTCIVHCEVDNETALKFHGRTANFVGTHKENYGAGKIEYATFSQDIGVWLGYDIPVEYEIDDVVRERFLTKVLHRKIR